jgi:uncharacterized protein (TIGR00730 family)
MTKLNAITVYCGSKAGKSPEYSASAATLGTELAKRGLRLIYGGGNVGLMGTLARACHDNGGMVTGIIPEFLKSMEVFYQDCDEAIITQDMHERKRLLFERGDAIIALPGGIGTLEELVEMLSWLQLGQHGKPIALYNLGGFWNPFIALLDHMHEEGFMRAGARERLIVVDDIAHIIDALQSAADAEGARPMELEPSDIPLIKL